MKKNLILLGMLTILSAVSFARDPFKSANDPTKARTYNWIVPDMKTNLNPMYNSSFSRQRIQKAFDNALGERGLNRNTKQPDLLLQFHTYTQKVRRNYYGGGGYPMMGRYGWGMPLGSYGYAGAYPSSVTNTDGTLILDVIDTKTGDIIWQKAITGDVSNPNRLDKQISKGVRKLMKDFPVQKG
ncbi:DUF4136 domain-containing protein [Dyadobacter psychrotolerans]|uniref:DUF4136 domain-containing protein n=1 Tax=Dyadobacter psychrotolerans TaxID=2541721 RepID=A0A4R5DKF2_9BACT|nr:DUF4136 domain-containing protein [Dyadobacter psychrotolerans]TDE14652.1 DUF4136 domain-containing protein [Dyadobacter psychrotolerans]